MLGLILAFFFINLTVPYYNEIVIKEWNIQDNLTFHLPSKDNFILKIWHGRLPDKIYINSVSLIHSIYRDRKNGIKELYYLVPARILKTGTNILNISTDKTDNLEKSFSIKMLNTLATSSFGVILFNPLSVPEYDHLYLYYVIFAILSVIFGLLLANFYYKFFRMDFDRIILRYVFGYIPLFLFMSALYMIARIIPIKFYFFRISFIGIVLFYIFFLRMYSIAITLFKELKTNINNIAVKAKEHALGYESVIWFLNLNISERLIYAAFFILFLTALLFCFKLTFLINLLANLAYLLLIAGFIGICVEFSKNAHNDKPDKQRKNK